MCKKTKVMKLSLKVQFLNFEVAWTALLVDFYTVEFKRRNKK